MIILTQINFAPCNLTRKTRKGHLLYQEMALAFQSGNACAAAAVLDFRLVEYVDYLEDHDQHEGN